MLLVGCTTDTYETGDGEYSYLRSDFGVARSDAEKKLVTFTTDGDKTYTFAQPVEKDWVATADSTYRVLVYFDESDKTVITPKGIGNVSVLRAKPLKAGEAMKTDPVEWTSSWISENGAYINLGLNLMVGVSTEETSPQIIGVVLDGSKLSTSGHKHYYLCFYHDQRNVPEYFSQTTYASIPVEGSFEKGDSVTLTVNTYNGKKQKSFAIQ